MRSLSTPLLFTIATLRRLAPVITALFSVEGIRLTERPSKALISLKSDNSIVWMNPARQYGVGLP